MPLKNKKISRTAAVVMAASLAVAGVVCPAAADEAPPAGDTATTAESTESKDREAGTDAGNGSSREEGSSQQPADDKGADGTAADTTNAAATAESAGEGSSKASAIEGVTSATKVVGGVTVGMILTVVGIFAVAAALVHTVPGLPQQLGAMFGPAFEGR